MPTEEEEARKLPVANLTCARTDTVAVARARGRAAASGPAWMALGAGHPGALRRAAAPVHEGPRLGGGTWRPGVGAAAVALVTAGDGGAVGACAGVGGGGADIGGGSGAAAAVASSVAGAAADGPAGGPGGSGGPAGGGGGTAAAADAASALLDDVSARTARTRTRTLRRGIGELRVRADLLSVNSLTHRAKAVRFAKSLIHGYGLFAAEPVEAGDLVVEYVGELLRRLVSDVRELAYVRQGLGDSYMFRLNADTVIDATRKGAVARFINHSCEPNVVARVITVDGAPKIVFYAKARIEAAEELTYDYKFEFEDEKIPCLCGAPTCRGSLN